MNCELEPEIWSRDTGQQMPCFDRCQLIITWMSNIREVYSKPSYYFGVWPGAHGLLVWPIIWSMAAMLRDSTAAAVVVCTQ